MLKGRQRVGGFAGLGNSNNQGTRVRHAIAVAVFTGNFYIDGNLGNGLYPVTRRQAGVVRSEEHTSELQSLMRISYAVFCLKKKKNIKNGKLRITIKQDNNSTSK